MYPFLYEACKIFECGDGWFHLINELSKDLEPLAKDLYNPEEFSTPNAIQVKEKYGLLRFYMSTETEEMSKLIRFAEASSAQICEICGKKGSPKHRNGWYATRCEECDF